MGVKHFGTYISTWHTFKNRSGRFLVEIVTKPMGMRRKEHVAPQLQWRELFEIPISFPRISQWRSTLTTTQL